MGLPRLVMMTRCFVFATSSTTARQVALNFDTVNESMAFAPNINNHGHLTMVILYYLLASLSIPSFEVLIKKSPILPDRAFKVAGGTPAPQMAFFTLRV